MSLMHKLKVGTEVLVTAADISSEKGVVRFVGKLLAKPDEYIGVELEQPLGKNNGEFQSKEYFKCEKKTADKKYGVFVKAKSLKLTDGTPVEEAFKDTKETKDNVKQPITKQPKDNTKDTKPSRVVPKVEPKVQHKVTRPGASNTAKNKLSNQLADTHANEMHSLKDELEKAYATIEEYKQTDAIKEMEGMKAKLKEYEESNRALKIESEKIKYSVNTNQDEVMKDLESKIAFFQTQKDNFEKEKAELKKKIAKLESSLEDYEGSAEMIESLTVKVDNWEAKYEKCRQELEAASVQIKNQKSFSGSTGSSANEGQLKESIKTLNEMVALLESDLKEEQDNNAQLKAEIETNAAKIAEFNKLEKKLKSKDEVIESLKAEVESNSDAAAFAEKLTIDMIKKEQGFKVKALKLEEYIKKSEALENETAELKEMVELQTSEMEGQEEDIQKILNEKNDLSSHITMLNGQIAKYKQKIKELTDNNSSLVSTIQEDKDEEVITRVISTADGNYQQKFYDLQKSLQVVKSRYLESQLQFSSIRNNVGVYMINMMEALPDTYTLRFYPEMVHLVTKIKSANDKLYLLFESASNIMRDRSDIYSKENAALAQWLLIVMDQVPILYALLSKIELAFVTGDSEEEVSDVLSHYVLRDQVTRIDTFANELLQRIATENIDLEVDFSPFMDPIENLDKISIEIKKLPAEYTTKLDVCTETMRTIHKILESINIYKTTSEASDSAQVDSLVENFLKMIMTYLKECCTNPQVRLKNQMRGYLNGLDLIVRILKEIELEDTIQELSSLYSETEDIKELRETIVTTQFHVKELLADLDNIVSPTPLSKIHTKLPGKVWQERIKAIKDDLNKFQQTVIEKEDLEKACTEFKMRILVLEKEIKDRQSTKDAHEKRIGELQLRVDQTSSIEVDYKRQTEKMRSLQEANKLIEDELQSMSKRKKELEEELKRSKEKYDTFQTETVIKNRKQKITQNLSNEDIANLAIFKAVIKECNHLRHSDLKKKTAELKHSSLLQGGPNPEKQTQNAQSLRRKMLNSMCELTIKENGEVTSNEAVLEELNRFQFGKNTGQLGKQCKIGRLFVRGLESQSVSLYQSHTRMISF